MTTKKHDVPEELLSGLLANYKKPEDLIGENGCEGAGHTGPQTHQHTCLQSAKQRHGREFREYLQTRLRGAYGSVGCQDGVGAIAQRLRALQRGASAFIAENAFASGVQEAAGRTSAPGTGDGPGALLRLGRGREYGGNINLGWCAQT